MANPRATARQWLADLLIGTSVGIKIGPTGMVLAVGDIADAILSAPGVTVSSLTGPAERWGPGGSLCVGPDLETRIAIMLPAEEGTGT